MIKKEELKQKFEEAFDDTEKKEEAARALMTQADAAILAWGDRETVIATGIRIKTMLPGGEKLNVTQALAAGQYAVATGLNPFRGEFYAMVDKKGDLKLIDGYKALTRWAEDECPYDVQYRPQPLGPGEAHHIRAIIMRHDRKKQLDYYLERGADFQTAFDLVTTSAVGIVTEDEMRWPDGNPKDPPKGWTWEQRAEIRALKNALNRSHGMPTVAELARKSWEVAGILTKPEDWEGTGELKTPEEREALAELSARTRETVDAFQGLSPEGQLKKLAENVKILHGDFDEDNPFGETIDMEPPIEEPPDFQVGDTVDLSGMDGEDIHGPATEEEREPVPRMTLGKALGTALHADAPKLGLKRGDYLLAAVRQDAKDLIEYLTMPSAYQYQTTETEGVQQAAYTILAQWDRARETVLKEREPEPVEEIQVDLEEGGGTPPLF